jgi:CelD/BcsL family acetyltransferase involved in cellulose biosynthesis
MPTRSLVTPYFEVHSLQLGHLGPGEFARWRDLELRALEPNPNLSPNFVIPVLRHLDSQGDIVLQVVRRPLRLGGEWMAVVPLRQVAADRFLPVPHYKVELSKHAFLSGLLVDASQAQSVLELIYLDWQKHSTPGVVMETCRSDGPTFRLLRQLAQQQGLLCLEVDGFDRAGMVPTEMGEADLQRRLPSRAKKRRSHLKKLSALAEVSFRWWMGREIDDGVIERFLALENMGWKGENGSSLLSRPNEAAFFREMIRSFAAQEQAWFVELCLGDRVIASSSNLRSGRGAAAFKIGYDPEFSAYAPGINCELELMCAARQRLSDVDDIDSGTVAGSYVEELWPRRHRVATVIFATSALGQVVLGAANGVRSIKRVLRERRTAQPTAVTVQETAPA